MSRILVVDDEPAIGWGLREYLRDLRHDVLLAGSVEAAWETARDFQPEAVLLDVRLPGCDGLSAIPDFRRRWGEIPIIVMTAFGDLATAVGSVQQGAFEYLTKPFDLEAVGAVIERAVQVRTDSASLECSPTPSPVEGTMLGSSPAMQEVFKAIALVAPAEVPVLILGETGTGKELAAQAIHRHGQRPDGPFIPVCLAALSSSVVESELFGHVRGSFTGAVNDRPGLLELADGGTLFLDEIGDTPPAVQVKLLRFLETRRFTRVGSGEFRSSNARIVAATHRDLAEQVPRGEFREDLLFRLRGFELRLPALRERPTDIPILAENFWSRARPERKSHHLDTEFRDELLRRTWTGNVRELRSAIEHAAILSRGGPLLVQHLPAPLSSEHGNGPVSTDLGQAVEVWYQQQLANSRSPEDVYREFLANIEPALFNAALAACNGNRAAAARQLGLDRTTLRTKLRAYGLDRDAP